MKPTIGLIGCGNWGKYILRDLVTLRCDVIVVARSSESKLRALEGGAKRIVSSITELPLIDGVVVASTTTTHAEIIAQLICLNIPIFVEKPLSNNPISANKLAEAAPERLFVMDKWRYHPGVEMLAKIAHDLELGPVIGLRSFRNGWGNPHPDVDGVWILAPHDLSITLEILKEIPPPQYAIAEVIDGIPVGLVGMLGHRIENSPWVMFEVSTRSLLRHREIQLHCRDGVAMLVDSKYNEIQIVKESINQQPEIEIREFAGEMPLFLELKSFLNHIKGGPPPRSSAKEGALIVETISKLRKLAGIKEKEYQYA